MGLAPMGPTFARTYDRARTYRFDGSCTYDKIDMEIVTCIPNLMAKLTKRRSLEPTMGIDVDTFSLACVERVGLSKVIFF